MKKYLLAICIPTYNRSKYLKGLLENISSELKKCNNSVDIQIVIVDGHSSDDTEAMVTTFKIECEIKYYRREVEVGVDKDIMKCVELADAQYCWLFSDDDLFTDGAIKYLFSVLKKENKLSGCFCNRIPFDFKMERKVAEIKDWPGKKFKDNQLFVDKSECIKNIGMDYGFLSSQVINRSIWQKAVEDEDFGNLFKRYYLMVDTIFKMMNKNCRWLYIHQPLLKQRTGNDTLLNKEGVIKRQTVEHVNLGEILNLHYDCDSVEHYLFRKKMVNRLPRALANLKSQNISYSIQYYLFKLLYKKYKRYYRFWVRVVPIFLMPNIFLLFVKKFYFKYLV
jgi:abequosyltransferase